MNGGQFNFTKWQMRMTIDQELFAELHRGFTGLFPGTPPKLVPRTRDWFKPESEFELDFTNTPPAFSDIQSIAEFIPFLEPAVGNLTLVKHHVYKAAVLLSFEQTIKDSGFIYPLRLSDDFVELVSQCDLGWVATASLDDLRRLMCGIVFRVNAGEIESYITNGIIPAILKRFRDTPRTSTEKLALLILSFDPMNVDYGYEDEYEPEAREILEKLPLCNNEEDAQAMICDVFQRWFHDDRAKEYYAPLSSEIWSWFKCAA